MLAIVGSMPRFGSLSFFLINLWCKFCPPLYIFYAEEFEPIILVLKKAVLEQLTPNVVLNAMSLL